MTTTAAADNAAETPPRRSSLLRTFRYASATPAHTVTLAADFNHWTATVLTRAGDNEWRGEQLFEPAERGVYMFKYQVDGQWQYDPRFLTCRDEHGNVNNVVEVLGSAIHEHDTFQLITEPSDAYPNMASDSDIIVICDACQSEKLQQFHHCTTCHTFDYCTHCYASRHERSNEFSRDTSPATLAAWVVATRALSFWETHPPMQRDADDLPHYLAFAKTLDGILKQNGITNTAFEACRTEEDVFCAIKSALSVVGDLAN